MTRMTNHIREKLLGDLIKRSFHDRAQIAVNQRAAFARRLYQESFTAKEHDRMKALPEGWLPTTIKIKVQMAHEVIQVSLDGGSNGDYRVMESEFASAGVKKVEDCWVRVPYKKYNNGSVFAVFDAGSDTCESYYKMVNELSDLRKEISEATTAIRKVLESVGSVKKLIEVWPEVEAFAKPYLSEGERRAILPAIPREKINSMLGLPPSDKEQIA